MPLELKVPEGSESITEVYIGEWQVAVGDYIEENATLVELETDKANQPLTATKGGVVTKILKEYGDTAEPGEVIAVIDETADKPASDEQPDQESSASSSEKPTGSAESTGSAPSSAPQPDGSDNSDNHRSSDETRVMPAAARELHARGLSASDVSPSGPGGRLLKEDVIRHETTPAPTVTAESSELTSMGSIVTGEPQEDTVRMSPIRQRIAKVLVSAQQTAALLTTFNEVDMTNVMALRKQYQEHFVAKYDIKLGFMSFFVKAVIDALKSCPELNAEIRGRDIVYKNYFNIGIAVGSKRGLVVPVIFHADRYSFAETELQIKEYAKRAQANGLTPEELTGGTFTISNGGVYGSLLSTPIVNPPQSGVLGMHSIQQRAVVVDGEVVARPMMYLALTYDHRIVDGQQAVTFLRHIKDVIEDPARMLLEI